MMRPVIQPFNDSRKKRHSSSLGNVFKSIAETFRTQPQASRYQGLPIVINPTVVGGTANQKELFKKITSSSLKVRSEAIVELTDSVEEFSISSISEIWYASKDLLALEGDSDVRRKCLSLMISCIKHDDLTSPAIRLTYYEDIMTYCCLDYLNATIDCDFDLLLTCLEVLTKDGKDIHDYCLNVKHPLQHFLSISLLLSFAHFTRSDESKHSEDILVRLIKFTKKCVSRGANLFDEKSLEMMCQQLASMAHSCSSRSLMLPLLDFMELLISLGVPTILFNGLIETLSYLYSFEKETSWELLTMLLENSSYLQMTLMSLCDMILYTERTLDMSKEDNITITINKIDILGRIVTENFSEHVTESLDNLMYFIINALHISSNFKVHSVNLQILQFVQTTLSKSPNTLAYQYWSTDEISIFKILENIIDTSSSNDGIENELERVRTLLTELSTNGRFPGNNDDLMTFYLKDLKNLSDSDILLVLDYCNSRSACVPFFDDSESSCEVVMKIFNDLRRSTVVRMKSLNLILSSFSFEFGDDDVKAEKLRDYLFQWIYCGLEKEKNDAIVELLTSEFLLKALLKIEQQSTFIQLLNRIVEIFEFSQNVKMSECITKTFCKLFVVLSTYHNDEFKSVEIFNCLINMAKISIKSGAYFPLLIISKLMIRIRRKESGYIFFADPVDIEGLSAAFNRNFFGQDESSVESKNVLSWYYPEIVDYIPTELIDVPSKVLGWNSSFKVGDWLSIVVSIMEDFYDWEIYSLIWSHFCPQLSNLELFVSDPPLEDVISDISKLRRIVCDHLSSKLPLKLIFPKDLNKADLQIAMIRTLTALIAYHEYFSKTEEDLLIKSTVDGLSTSWEKTAIPSIHFLNLSCYEIPLSVKKYLSLILIKLQTRISSFFASPHILEFLMALSHLPSLSSNFNLEEYKRIFGISFQFIEFCKINRSNGQILKDEVFVNKHGEDVKVENVPSTELINITPALSQYLLGLSYCVISSWFLKMKINERRALEPFIVRNLILSSKTSENRDLDDQTLGFLDFITRFSFTDSELEMGKGLETAIVGKFKTSDWLCNHSILTLNTNSRYGELIVRKASDFGTVPMTADTSVFWDQLHETGFNLKVLQNCTILKNPKFDYLLNTEGSDANVLRLYADIGLTRSKDNLARLPIVQFSKAGIMYIRSGQSTESEILSNRFGSPQYEDFLTKIGHLVRLQNCDKYYVGGLDTENNIDGEFAIFWRDKITQLVFHTVTLMPNNVITDPGLSMKKRHVGNNYVNVYFDESGLPFDFNVIKSQFNFINIVISPVSKKYFRVKVYRRNGVPAVFAACHFKLISGSRLAAFVRNLVLVCHEFSSVWNFDGQFTSNWSRRVLQINKFHQFLDEPSSSLK